jgi:hypothetical protein
LPASSLLWSSTLSSIDDRCLELATPLLHHSSSSGFNPCTPI